MGKARVSSPVEGWTRDRSDSRYGINVVTNRVGWAVTRARTDCNRCRGRRSATCIPGGAYALPAVGGTLLSGRGLVPEVADP